MNIAELVYTITGTTPAAAGPAVIGSVIDFQSLPGTTQQDGLEVVDDLDIVAAIKGATGGTLDLCLQVSPDGSTWTDFARFATITAAAPLAYKSFAVCRQAQALTMTTVGQGGTTMTLTVNTVTGGPVPRYMRLLAIANASTTAGAVQTLTLIAHGPRKSLD